MSFQQGLSGLNAASKNLDVIGNNVSNAQTVGFKVGQAQFADVFAASLAGSGSSPVGIGTKLAAVTQQFTQGNITSTNNPLDVAINGGGFFIARNNGETSYTRNGQFQLDKDGFIVTNANYRVAGYQASNVGGIIPTLADLRIPKDPIPPSATGTSGAGVQASLNFDSTSLVPSVSPFNYADPTTYNNTTSTTVYDNTGAASVYSMYFVRTTPSTWNIYSVLTNSAGDATPLGNTSLTGGSLASPLITASDLADIANAAGTGSTVPLSTATTANIVIGGAGGTRNWRQAGTIPVNATTTGGTITLTAGTGVVGPLTNGSYYPISGATISDGTNTLTNVNLRLDKNTGDVTIVSQSGGPLAVGARATNTAGTATPLTGTNYALTFTTAGVLKSGTQPYTETVPTAILASSGSPLSFSVSLGGSTQYAGAFSINTLTQDGYGRGLPAGFNIGPDGVITGRYTNGQTKSLGQFVLGRFPNNQGLQPIGNNLWNESSTSGSVVQGQPGVSGDFGLLQSSATEDSNVDLTAELVNMITAQRVYQANAQTIKTVDAVMQTLINLR